MSAVDEDVAMSDLEPTSLESMNSNSPDAVLSAIDDLNPDFYNALKGFLNFKGSFYHHSAHSWPHAPDPELTIEGVGKIPLPLSEKDAQSIISRASQAPFGKGEDTVVDTSVRDTWEVQPADISFGNADWTEFVDRMASKNVWESLGVAPFTTPPRCELHKLLLYQTGSHFLPHQDSSKAEGMFATVVIVLPCDFEGGEVHVSHGGRSAVLDAAANAADCEFSVLAWYTDVVHEVKPVKSGYRLALSYNLIHTSPSLPRPSMPKMDAATQNLRRVLQTWNDGGYKTLPKVPFLAYILSHWYSAAELQKGEDCLKGVDAYVVEHLLPMSKDLDFSVCLGHLTRMVKGDAGEERNNGDLVMAYVEEDTMEVSRLVRINSELSFKLGFFEVEGDALVPKDHFDTAVPDEEEFEGYTGNDGAPLEQQYLSSVILLFRNADQTSIVTRVKGLSWVLEHLESKSLNLDLRVAADTALISLKEIAPRRYADEPSVIDGAAQAVSRLALDWKDETLWSAVLNLGHLSLKEKAATVKQALGIFDLDHDAIRPALLQYVLDCGPSFDSRVRAIEGVAASAGEKASPAWLVALTQDALMTYDAAEVCDVKSLASFAHHNGLRNVLEILVRQLGIRNESGDLKGDYRFFIKLAEALCNHPATEGSDKTQDFVTADDLTLPEAVHKCLLEALARWEQLLQNEWTPEMENKRRSERICEIVDVSLTVQDLDPCIQLLFSTLNLQPGADVASKFRYLYQPLVRSLKVVLEKHEKGPSSEPFRAFFKDVISLYLQRILGSVDVAPPLPYIELRYIADEGKPGQEFVAFVNSPDAGPIRISGVAHNKLRRFTGEYGDAGPTTTTAELTDRLRKEYTLTVHKKPEALVPYTWESRRAAAIAFLAEVADDDGLKVIMSEFYGDLKMALDGEKAFGGIQNQQG